MEFNKNDIEKIGDAENNVIEESADAEAVTETPKKGKTKRKMSLPAKIILTLSIIVFLCSLVVIIHNYLNRQKNIKMNTELHSVFFVEDGEDGEEVKFNFEEMLKKNPGFVGWIYVPNTSISLPVVKYADNSFYLTHNFYKERDRRGTVFMDYRNDPVELDANTILYGHNCYDGKTMFSELEKYQEIDFYKTSPVIEFATEKGNFKWKVYAVFITNAKENEDNGYIFNYIYPYMDGENFDGFISEVNKRRLYATDVDINDDDNMLILSTCIRKLDIYNKGKRTYKADSRLVVLARKLREGESADVNVENVTLNPSPKYPQIWYDKNGIKNPYASDEKWYPQEVS